jgi:hypothetical protein
MNEEYDRMNKTAMESPLEESRFWPAILEVDGRPEFAASLRTGRYWNIPSGMVIEYRSSDDGGRDWYIVYVESTLGNRPVIPREVLLDEMRDAGIGFDPDEWPKLRFCEFENGTYRGAVFAPWVERQGW